MRRPYRYFMNQSDEQKMLRYARQIILPMMGVDGQKKLLASKVVIVGCGGLGCTISQILVRSGIGEITVCDSDTVELENLHRQILYDEQDIGHPKAMVAASKLLNINSQVNLHAKQQRIDENNVGELIEASDLIIDATDNLVSRYMINKAAVAMNRDWIYGGCVESQGTVMVIRRSGACLECVFGRYDPETQSQRIKFPILPTAPVVVGAIESNAAIEYLLAKDQAINGSKLISIDLGQMRVHCTDAIEKNEECFLCK